MSEHPTALASQCPKRMEFGPCGGVHDDHSCEVDARAVPFVTARWDVAPPRRAAVPLRRRHGPLVLADVRIPDSWRGDVSEAWRRTADALQGCGVLLGEHVDNLRRHDDAGATRPSAAVELLAAGGARPIVTVTGRDRDLVGAEAAVRAHRAAGAVAIHCVTGDHPRALGLERPAEFGAESTTLAELATRLGAPVSVAESPASPGDRTGRVLAKERAGASLCVLNHGGDPDEVVAFVDACRGRGRDAGLRRPGPDGRRRAVGRRARGRFPGLRLPAGYLDAIASARDPVRQGIASAEELTARLAASGRFVGINLSGSARDHDPAERLRSTVEFVQACRTAWNGPPERRTGRTTG